MPVARLLRLCERFHAARARGQTFASTPRRGADGTAVLDALPAPGLGDGLLLRGHRARLVIAAGAAPTPWTARGDVALVLGAGNLTATPLLDTIDQVLLHGRAVVLKLMLVDLSGSGTVARIVSFIGVGVLMLVIGYVAPLPTKANGAAKVPSGPEPSRGEA